MAKNNSRTRKNRARNFKKTLAFKKHPSEVSAKRKPPIFEDDAPFDFSLNEEISKAMEEHHNSQFNSPAQDSYSQDAMDTKISWPALLPWKPFLNKNIEEIDVLSIAPI